MAEGEGEGGAVASGGVARERCEAPGVSEGQLQLGGRSVAECDLPIAGKIKGVSKVHALCGS